MAPCAVTMRPPSVESVAMVRVRARETIVEGGRGYETPPPTPPRKRRPSPPATSPSQPRISPRCCKVPTPEPAAEKFVERGRVLQLGDGTKIRMDSPRLKQAMGHTGVMTDDIKPLKTADFVLAARREGKGEEQAKRIGVRRYNMHELLRQQHLAELLACRAQFPEPVRTIPTPSFAAAFLCPADILDGCALAEGWRPLAGETTGAVAGSGGGGGAQRVRPAPGTSPLLAAPPSFFARRLNSCAHPGGETRADPVRS